MKDPNYAPMYAALYPGLAKIARKHGYAMAVHGTLARDMDLICIPWTETPSESSAVVKEITETFHIRQIGEPDTTFHGRERWTISVGFGECFLDLQFMPILTIPTENKDIAMDITNEELELVRQWFNAVQDLNPNYLETPDYSLAMKIYHQLGIRVPSSILEKEE